jgi:nitroreductase
MSFLELVQARYSVRSYKPDQVSDELLEKVLEAARLAPTADNRQSFRLIVIRTAGRQQELKRIYNRDWFVQAPIVICVCAVPSEAWVRSDGRNYADIDAAIAMDHLTLAAADAGLGTCWIAAFDVKAAREVLGLPHNVEPLVFTPLGYPAEQAGEKQRKPLDELVHYERW